MIAPAQRQTLEERIREEVSRAVSTDLGNEVTVEYRNRFLLVKCPVTGKQSAISDHMMRKMFCSDSHGGLCLSEAGYDIVHYIVAELSP